MPSPDALRHPAERAFLGQRGVFVERAEFLERLERPRSDGLAALLGLGSESRLVYVAQQVCADYPSSVTAKFIAARDLAAGEDAAPVILWHDMDRAGSDKLAMRFVLPVGAERVGIPLAPRALKDREPRFIPVDRPRLQEAVTELDAWVSRAVPKDRVPDARARVERLADALLDGTVETLAEASRAVATCLLRERLAFEAPSAFVSELAGQGLMTEAMNALLAQLDEVVAVFNATVEDLLAAGVDPHIQALRDDYLPLRYSCPRDGIRIRLTRVRDGAQQLAVGRCRCGAEHRFELGGDSPTLGALETDGNWSPDVSLPMLLNGLVSGVVAGRSSARYGLVLNAVLERALGRRAVPMLLPRELADPGPAPSSTLLLEYLRG